MQSGIPLVYFFGLVPGRYAAAYPVFIVGDDPKQLAFSVVVDDRQVAAPDASVVMEDETPLRRRYVTAVTKQRLHQSKFRERVMAAYGSCCAVCRLRHPELLDAAHIVPDADPTGEPLISNGLSLCKIHHAAFENNFLGIRKDFIVEIRQDILREDDGPMLQYGLQERHNKRLLVLPRVASQRPREDFLERRYKEFLG
jgi:putative restriction endonuclease